MGPMMVIARWFERERYARRISLLFTIGGLGALMASTPLAAVSEAIGWRGAFLAMAAVTGVIAILLFVVVRDAPPGAAPAESGVETAAEMWRGMGRVLALRDMRWICAVQFVSYGTMITIVGPWAGPYLNDVHGLRGLTLQNLSVMLGVFVLQAIAGVIVGAFAPEGTEAPEIAYRAAFGFLALVLAAGIAAYCRVADVSPRGQEGG